MFTAMLGLERGALAQVLAGPLVREQVLVVGLAPVVPKARAFSR